GEAVTAVEFGPDGLQFDEPITVTLAYDPSALPPGVTEEELGFHLQVGDPAEGRWFFQAGSMVDPVTNTVSAPLSHFSTGGVAPVRLEPAASVAAAGSFTCAVNPDGQAFCWGRDNAGALGTNQTTATCKELGSPVGDSPIVTDPCSTVPMPVEGQIVFSQVSAADNSVCGVTTANDVYCWGRTLEAAFVAGDLPALVPGGTLFSQIDVGFRYACGTTTGGALACWGRNNFGQLGDGSTTESSSPVAVAGGVPLVSVDAGFWHSCGLTGLGEPFCWGRALFGVFGDGGVSPDSPLPVSAASGLTLAEIEPGTVFTCGLEPDGTAHCWGGFNQFVGQHGTGTFANSNVPVPVAGGLSFADVEAHSHNNVFGVNCGITTSGAAYCWGNDSNGQLGVGGAGNVCSTVVGDVACEIAPVAVTGGLTFAELSVGGLHVCGRTPAGELYCWGWNAWGQLGDGTQTDSNVPVRVASPVGG
ncbi:MAG: RCC1 domain-containing protein, partial [Gemmatimonadota bacterium]